MTAGASKLVGAGRSADVFEHGEGRVLRRYREARDTEREVAAMEHARSHGFPVPAARALSKTDIVMDRLAGPTMLTDLSRRPWMAFHHARELARLHDRLHAIRAPDWLPAPVGPGDALLHLDLHPDNVVLTARGPFVIDWPNVARGPAAADGAHTWLVLACAAVPGASYRRAASLAGRRGFLALFLGHLDRGAMTAELERVADFRLAYRNLPVSEADAIRDLVRRRCSGAQKRP